MGRYMVHRTLYQGDDWPSRSTSELWAREVHGDFLPQIGQRIATLIDDDEPLSGSVHEEVVDVYFGHDGTATVTLMACIVDPNEDGERSLRQNISQSPRNQRTSWWTARDGDLRVRMRESRWLPWEEWPEVWRA